MNLIDRFIRAREVEPARTEIIRPVARPVPSPAEVLRALLHGWAKQAPPAFDEHLVVTMERAHELLEGGRLSHPEMAYWAGYERAIRDVRAAFTQWSHPDAGTPTSSALQGGLNGQS